jgi:hypothetical protein
MAFNLSAFAGAGAQFFDANGAPLVGGKIFSYLAGTTTPAATYTDAAGTAANTNPIILDAAGRTPNSIFLSAGVVYKFELKTSTDTLIGTYDSIPGIDDPTAFNNLITVTGTDTLVGTSTPAIVGYVAGQTFSFVVANTNTGPVTLDVDGQGAKNVTVQGTTALVANQLIAGSIATVLYDGTRFQLTSLITGNLTVDSLNSGQLAGLRNKIINGKMEIAQRGTNFPAIAAGAYSLDRWLFDLSGTGVVTASQPTDVPSNNEFLYSLRLAVTTADTSIAAGDYANLRQRIEGFNARDLIGRTFTVSFWVRSSKVGVHCVAFANTSPSPDRSYVLEYTVNAADTWEKKSVTVIGGLITAGSWVWTTGIGLQVIWSLAAGTTFQTTAGSWQTGGFVATANQVNCLDADTNIFAITGVQLEVGNRATPFEHRPYGTELALCQRYYLRITPGDSARLFGPGQCTGSDGAIASIAFPVPMRARPSALEQNGTAAHYAVFNSTGGSVACSAVTAFNAHTTNLIALVNATVVSGLTAGNATSLTTANATAFLGWSAEL